jgi:hypothetical protein
VDGGRELSVGYDDVGVLTRGQIKTTQDLSTLIRDLQELWLFGGLDTLSDPADEETNRTKAVEVAQMIEVLAKSGPAARKENEVAELSNGNVSGVKGELED